MGSSSSVYVTREEFNLFHSIDRELYAVLVLSLAREPSESMQVMAFWLWLEQKGFRHVVKTILSLPHFLVNEAADECAAALSSSSAAAVLPLTQSLLENDHRPGAASVSTLLSSAGPTLALDLSRIVDSVCIRALSDVAANNNNNGTSDNVAPPPPPPPPPAAADSDGGGEVAAERRTMFATFSKGYPVQEWEVREFFRRSYGDSCIEWLHMQEVHRPGEQPLFARIVFKMLSTIELILNGSPKAKFTINGKHVWMRRFVPKKPKPQQYPPPPPPPLPILPASFFD